MLFLPAGEFCQTHDNPGWTKVRPMKIATYNILKGGRLRIHWIRMIEERRVDLLLVQESYPQDEHLPPLLYPRSKKRSVWEMVEQNYWGSAVYSKTGTLKRIPVRGFRGWVVGAELQGAAWQSNADDKILVFSIHAPSRAESYAKQVDKILDEISRLANGRELILGGDFNLSVSRSIHSDRPVSKQDLAIQARLAEEFGLINCWETANPDLPLPQTLRWTKDRTIPYHCDGLFVPQSWRSRLQSCVVLSGDDWDRLSDHNPVIADFN